MGNKFVRKMVAVFVAAAVMLTSGVGVFAAGSPTSGKVTKADSSMTRNGKSMTVTWKADKKADKYVVKVGKKSYTVKKGSKLSVKTKAGKTYKVTITPYYNGKAGEKTVLKRWAKTTKIKKAKAGKKKVTLTWKKVKGATSYKVLMYKKGSFKTVKTVKGTKATIKVAKKGKYSFKVVPVKKGYVGVRSVAKVGRAK